MINIRYLKILLPVLILITSAYAKVLFIVDSSYYYDSSAGVNGSAKIALYKTNVESIDNKSVDVIVFPVLQSGTVWDRCRPLRDTLVANYVASVSTGDTLEGAVLIGDIPEPEMFNDNRSKEGGEVYPVDYYYMDVWDTIGDTGFTVDTVLWKYPAMDSNYSVTPPEGIPVPYFDVRYETASGDEHMEIWVSRVYARTINLLRDSSFVYDSINDPRFLDNHEIISSYLDRVHERMTQRAKVPPRAFGMGHCPQYGMNNPSNALHYLKQSLPFDSLGLASTRYFVNSGAGTPECNPSNWQSQLQAGPYGTVNTGAFKGVPYDSVINYQNWKYPKFRDDSRGSEWAGIFEHSGIGGHSFNERRVALHGYFTHISNVPLWDRITTGGYRGSYYKCRNRDKLLIGKKGIDNTARWVTDTIRNSGDYSLYMWFFKAPTNDDNNYVSVFLNGGGNVFEGWVDMRGNSPEQWWLMCNSFHVNNDDVITVLLNANHHSNDMVNDASIADAVKFVRLSNGDTIVIDNEDPGFIREDSLNRSYYSMRDDGGPSKVPFYLLQACHINYYTADDNLGLLYAMGHDGLMSLGTSNGNSGFYESKFEYNYFLEALIQGDNFGDAFLYMANNYSSGIIDNDKFILCGAGTLKAQAYRPYSDCMFLLINNADITTIESHFVEQNVTINGMTGSSTTVHSGGGLSITAGNDIIILPEFHAEYGSEMLLKIDSSLKD